MERTSVALIGISAAAFALAACDGAGTSVAYIPPPPPPPPPVSNNQPALPEGSIGLQSDAPFATMAAAYNSQTVTAGNNLVQFAYDSSTDKYTITLPGYDTGQLVTKGGNGSYDSTGWIDLQSTYNLVSEGTTNATQDVGVILPWPGSSAYRYTSLGNWNSTDWTAWGAFAYGIPTAAGDVPVAGTATYQGEISGVSSTAGLVSGTVSLNFDFANASLTGVMKPQVSDWWDSYSLGDYAFRDTSFARGATTFSGSFDVPGSTAPSSFAGQFTGPQAAELMANWTAPYLDPDSSTWGTMSGVWIAKKP